MVIQPHGMFPSKPLVRSVLQDDYIDAGLWKGGIGRLDLTQKPGSWYKMAEPLEPGMPGNPWPLEGLGVELGCFFHVRKASNEFGSVGVGHQKWDRIREQIWIGVRSSKMHAVCLIDGHRETQQYVIQLAIPVAK